MNAPKRVAQVAIAIFAILLVLNIYHWSKNRSRLPGHAQISISATDNIYKIASKHPSFGRNFGCYYRIAELIRGASLLVDDDFSDYRWFLDRFGMVDVQLVETVAPVGIAGFNVAVERGAEQLRCDDRSVFLLAGTKREDYVWAQGLGTNVLIVPASLYPTLLSQSNLEQDMHHCDLLDASHWAPAAIENGTIDWSEGLKISIEEQVKRLYVSTGHSAGFDEAPKDEVCPVRSGETIALSVQMSASKKLAVSAYVIEYGAKGRLLHTSYDPQIQPVSVITLSNETTSVRVALRFAGQGVASISKLELLTPRP